MTNSQLEITLANMMGIEPLCKDGLPSLAALMKRKREVGNIEFHLDDPTLAMEYSHILTDVMNERVEQLAEQLDEIKIQAA